MGAVTVVVIVVLLLVQVCSCENHYKVLRVSKNASPREIKRAYIKLARIWHPDKNKDSSKEASDMMSKINRAYEILSDEDKRRHYDLLEYEPSDDDYTHTTTSEDDDVSHESTTTDDEINTQQFMDSVLPASERTPYLIYFFHDFCDRCEDWTEVLSEMKTELKGIEMASVNVIISSKVASYCNIYVHEVPQLVLILDRQPHPFQESLSVDTVKRFIYNQLPSNITRSAHVRNANDILSMETRIVNNKPVVLLVSPHETPSLEYKLSAYHYQQYMMFYFVSSLDDEKSRVLQTFSIKPKESSLRIYADFPDPVVTLQGHDQIINRAQVSLEKHKFLTLPKVDSCVLLDGLCPVGENKNWCVLLVTVNRTISVANEFRNFASNQSNEKFKFGSLNNNQDSILSQSIPSLNITLHDNLCDHKMNSKSVLFLRRPKIHTLQYQWFDEYCGTRNNNTKLSKLLQHDNRVTPPHTATVSESCWFLPPTAPTIDDGHTVSTIFSKFFYRFFYTEHLIVWIALFMPFLLHYVILHTCHGDGNQAAKHTTKFPPLSNSRRDALDKRHNSSLYVSKPTHEDLSSGSDEPHSDTSDDEVVQQWTGIGTRQVVPKKQRKKQTRDASTQTDNEGSTDDEGVQQTDEKRRKPSRTRKRHDNERSRSTLENEKFDLLKRAVDQEQWEDQSTSTDYARLSSSNPIAPRDNRSFNEYRHPEFSDC